MIDFDKLSDEQKKIVIEARRPGSSLDLEKFLASAEAVNRQTIAELKAYMELHGSSN